MSMEKLGQNYGYILYRSNIENSSSLGEIRLWEANDRANIFVDEELVATLYDRELLSNKKTPINYSIENLKEIFGLGDKYKLTANFINKVIVPAKKELDSRSPYTFHYEPIKTGRKITSIHFVPIYQPQFEDENLKKQKLNKQMSNKWFIPKNIYDFLIHNFNFTDKELNNNLNLFENLYNNMSEEALLDFLVDIRFFASNADNPKGFIIGSLKKKAEQIFEQKYGLNNK